MSVTKAKLIAYAELMKPRILLLVLVTTYIGYFLGSRDANDAVRLVLTLLGTSLLCGGAGVLNNYLERDVDCLMKRTQRRPLPRGIVEPADVLGFGLLLVLFGVIVLSYGVNLLSGFLGLLTVFLYVLVYTPLKRITWLNTLVGAIPGALPPMGGWAAGSGQLEIGAWILFAILFIWQHPHFYAIAWMYKDDYARGGLKMLPVIDPTGKRTFRQIVIFSLLLIPVSLTPVALGASGNIYLIGATASGLLFLVVGTSVAISKKVEDARKLLRASVIYLPVLFTLLAADCRF